MRKVQCLGHSLLVAMFWVLGCSSADSNPSDGAGTGGATATAGNSMTSPSGGLGGTLSTGGSAGGAAGVATAGGVAGGGTPAATAGTSGSQAGTAGSTAGTASGSGGSTACGAPSGAAFPAVTDYSSKDGGFGPALTARNSGDASLGETGGMPNKVAVFRPAAAKYGQGGVRHPLVVWGNGHTNTVDIWQNFLARVATYGFVVVAPEQTEVTAEHMNEAIDYALRLAREPTGVDCGKIDTTKIAATGYSRGGMGAITIGANARIGSTFVFASRGNAANLKAPWAVIGGDMDATFTWSSINDAVMGSSQPAFGAALAGIDHNRVAGQAKAQQAYLGWLRWRFMADQAGHDMFVGPSCEICSDSAFSAVAKTPSLDSL